MNSYVMNQNNASSSHRVSDRLAFSAMRNWKERLSELLLLAAAAVSVLTTLGIVYVLLSESIVFFSSVYVFSITRSKRYTNCKRISVHNKTRFKAVVVRAKPRNKTIYI